MESEQNQFIEIRRVLSDANKINTSSQPEVIRVSLIETFRAWHKGKNDRLINGDMTVLVLKDKKREEYNGEIRDYETIKSGVRTMLIEESYDNFLYRMSIRSDIKLLPNGSGHDIQGKQGA